MSFVYALLVFLHFVGAAALVGGWLVSFKSPTVHAWQLYGAWLQLLTGLGLVGLLEMNDAKIGVKLVIVIAVLVAAILARRKIAQGQDVSTGLAHAVGGLSLINIAIAVFW